MKIKLLIIILLINTWLFSQNKAISYGIPATPEIIKYIQPDGSVLNYHIKGDGLINWKETIDGYAIKKADNLFYYYIVKSETGNYFISDIKPETGKSTPENAIKGIPYDKIEIENIRQRYIDNSGIFETKSFPTHGTNNLLLFLVDFPDDSFTIAPSVFDSMFNIDNFNGTGSFRQFYLENSYGHLNVITTVRGWYTAPEHHDYYGHEDSLYNDHVRELVRYLVDQAELEGVDFSVFDNDNDSVVDGIMVIHSGKGAETGDETSIWSHSWRLGTDYQVVYDNVLINDYTINPEFNINNNLNGIGTVCHEFGHNLGLPDYYDTNYGIDGQSEHLGTWDLMASGSYNNNSNTPAQHNAYSKEKLNWLTIQTLDSSITNICLPNLEYDTIAYKFYTTTPNEFFFMENRQKVGFDQYIPGHGMLIYHIDENHHGAWNSNALHQAFDLEEADGTTSHGAGDAFPYGNNEFTDMSVPAAVAWSGYYTNKPVTNITESNDTVCFDFMQINKPPVGNFLSDKTNICEGVDIEFVEDAAFFADSVLWFFEGGNPNLSTDKNPVIHYDTEGDFDVTLIVKNSYGSDTLILDNYIHVGTPSPQFARFDGANDYIEMPALNLHSNTVTIEAFIRPLLFQEDWAGIIFCRGDSTVAGLSIRDDNELRYHWNGSKYDWFSGLYVPMGMWSHVALVITPDSAIIYLNDTLAVNLDSHGIEEFNTEFRIGHDRSSRYYRGLIDEVRIWNINRNLNDIQLNRCSIPDPQMQSDLVAYYNFNECGGSILNDQKSGLNGILYNMTPNSWINGEPCDFSGLYEINEDFYNIKVFPNPAKGILNIEFDNDDDYIINIYNTQGTKLNKYYIKADNLQIDIRSFRKGLYLIKISNNSFTKTLKFIKE